MKRKQIVRKVALVGIMAALAVALSFLESMIPPIPGFPPGAKPGLSNIVTMFLVSSVGIPYAFFVTVLKGIFAGITRGATAMFMSISGGILSTAVACILFRSKKPKLGYIGSAIICAVCHNIGQLITACVISGTPSLIWGYGPLLLIFAVAAGFITGAILRAVLPALDKIYKRG